MGFLLIFAMFFLPSKLQAQTRYLSFCAADNFAAVKKAVTDIAIQADQVIIRDQDRCLDIVTKEERVELYEAYLEHRFGIYNQAVKKQEDACRFTLQKKIKEDAKGRDFSIGQKNILQENKSTLTASEDSSLVILSGEQGLVAVDSTRVYLKCQKINMNSYKVEVSVLSEPPSSPPAQEVKQQDLSTTVEMSKGSQIFLGEILKDLDAKSRTLGYPQGIGLSQNVKDGVVQFHLSME